MEELKGRSGGGTAVPVTIVHQRGIRLDGSHPTWLSGYGAYGTVNEAVFAPRQLAWLERGAIYAIAHVRGGGEYGEEWHAAAKKQNKQRSIDDYIACAQFLIEHKYTSPRHLGAEGTSAGGITVGGAITQQPAVFAP